MKEARSKAKLSVVKNGSGVPCFVFRYWETLPDGSRKRRMREVGKVADMTLEEAEKIVEPWREAVAANREGPHSIQTMGELIAHFRLIEKPHERETSDDRAGAALQSNENERAWSTWDRYDYALKAWLEPRWANVPLKAVIAGEVEVWLRSLTKKPTRKNQPSSSGSATESPKPLAPGTRAKVRNIMSVLFNHAIRWNIFPSNPIAGPARKAGVRQSGKRQAAPDILDLAEMRLILPELSVRERGLISVDMITGIRRGELAGLKWKDIDFANLLVNVVRSVVDQRTGKCKTEASAKPVPIDKYTAEDLLAWYRLTPYRDPEDWVFASDDPCLGDKRGKQPLWLSKIMQYHIQPLVRRLGITKRVSWQTFRSTFTSLLTANNENVKVVQDLLRHASSKITMDVYAQARMQDKRSAQLRIVEDLRKPHKVKAVAAKAPKAGPRLVGKKSA